MDSFFGWAGLIGTILGIYFAWYFYAKALRLKEPFWNFKNVNLVRDSISQVDGLEMLYKGEKIPSLSIGKVVFWNRGAETISGTDITTADPIRILPTHGGRILSAKLVKANHPANQLRVDVDPSGNFATISFDYLDRNHGGIIEFVHTGKTVWSVKVVGSIKGVSRLQNKRIGVIEPKQGRLPNFVGQLLFGFMGLAMLGFGGSILVWAVISIFFPGHNWSLRTVQTPVDLRLVFMLLAGILLTSAAFFLFYITRDLSVVEPKGLEIYDEDVPFSVL